MQETHHGEKSEKITHNIAATVNVMRRTRFDIKYGEERTHRDSSATKRQTTANDEHGKKNRVKRNITAVHLQYSYHASDSSACKNSSYNTLTRGDMHKSARSALSYGCSVQYLRESVAQSEPSPALGWFCFTPEEMSRWILPEGAEGGYKLFIVLFQLTILSLRYRGQAPMEKAALIQNTTLSMWRRETRPCNFVLRLE